MTPWIIVTLVVAFVVFDVLVLIPVIFRLVAHFTWKPLMEQFPARAPAAEARLDASHQLGRQRWNVAGNRCGSARPSSAGACRSPSTRTTCT